MVKIEKLFEQNKIRKINEFEKERYLTFLSNSYKDNLEHSKFIIDKFPRWSIISGYYSMHDLTKFLIAKKFNVKIELEVHKTTLILFDELLKDKKLLILIERGYEEFIYLASDLNEAKKERVKAQYYTGTHFSKKYFVDKAEEFHKEIVFPFILKIEKLVDEK